MLPAPLPGQPLPVDAALPRLVAALDAAGVAVLVAPPGAGKTTRVPLALLGQAPGRIVMLEPRRIAARAAARRLAATLGERVGETVGLRVRGETRVSRADAVEVVTEGVLTRLLLSDPEAPRRRDASSSTSSTSARSTPTSDSRSRSTPARSSGPTSASS